MGYSVNGIQFKTKKAVQEYAKNILYRGDIGQPIRGDDLDFMLDFFKTFHHQWEMKEGAGIQHLYRILEPKYKKHRAFFILRIDGSTTDISYRISNIQQQNWKRDFNEALRQTINPQIYQFKDKVFAAKEEVQCPFTGEIVQSDNCHVDHYNPTFDELVEMFVKQKGITDFSEVVSAPADNQMVPTITDSELELEFYIFHKKNANLRITSILGNLSIAKSNRR